MGARWYAVHGWVMAIAQERVGRTGNLPVAAETPLLDGRLDDERKR
jgi:L-asparagine permease